VYHEEDQVTEQPYKKVPSTRYEVEPLVSAQTR
jgi:hypothetical protein